MTYNEKGQVEGVKYHRIGVVLINAVKEQQRLIERQQKSINEMTILIEDLRQKVDEIATIKEYLCSQNSKSKLCN